MPNQKYASSQINRSLEFQNSSIRLYPFILCEDSCIVTSRNSCMQTISMSTKGHPSAADIQHSFPLREHPTLGATPPHLTSLSPPVIYSPPHTSRGRIPPTTLQLLLNIQLDHPIRPRRPTNLVLPPRHTQHTLIPPLPMRRKRLLQTRFIAPIPETDVTVVRPGEQGFAVGGDR